MPESAPPLFFHEGDVAPGWTLSLEKEEAEHGRSLRLKPGDRLTLLNGQGRVSPARVLETKGRRIEVQVVETGVEERPAGPAVWLGAAVIRGPRYDFVVEKATELGVAGLIPVISRYTEVRPVETGTRPERWRRLAIAAMKQSQRVYLPEIREPTDIRDVLKESRFESIWVAHPGAVREIPARPAGDLLLLTGPEGGWAETEIELFREHGASFISLGFNRLRAETAALAMLVLARALAGEMGAADPGSGDSGSA